MAPRKSGVIYEQYNKSQKNLYEFFDISFHREGSSGRCISIDNISFSVDEKLGKIPLDSIPEDSSFFSLEELVEWMSIITINVNFRKKRKCHSKIELAGCCHSFIGFRFLIHKLIARKTKNHKIIVWIGVPECFEFFKLWSQTTLGGSIHNEENFSLVVRE